MTWYWVGLRMKTETTRISKYLKIFAGGALLYLAAVLPFLIYHGGYFFYYGDYNVQQVPFLILLHRSVREGRLFWNPYIDLGSSTGGAFAFYLFGSPFFWLSLPFPERSLPYVMPFLMALKYGTAATTSYAYIRTLTRTDRGALLGALLYSFSGFQACNIVFQHFHDATAFFPLYLLCFDRFVQKKDRAGFILMTAVMSIVNYFFFYGQVLFLILYYVVRYWIGGRRKPKRVLGDVARLVPCGLLGLGMSAFYLVQVIDTVAGNTRLSSTLLGYDILAYSEPTTPLAILKSMFMVPDIIGRGTMFTSDQVKNSSLSAYLPVFSVSGVYAYLKTRSRDWKKNLLLACLVIAFVPVLNSAFAAFNEVYYARWFYMPLLFACVMTVTMLEQAKLRELRQGTVLASAGFLFLAACSFLPTKDENGYTVFGELMEYPGLFWIEVLATGIALLLLIVIVTVVPRGRIILILTAAGCLVTTMGVLFNGTSLIAKKGGDKWKYEMLDSRPELPQAIGADGQFARVEADGTSTNYEMVWGYPTIHCFESTVAPSIFAFYDGIGVSRTVDSKLSLQRIGARAILSAKYYLENDLISQDDSYSKKGGMTGYEKAGESGGYNIYRNTNYLPMGFTFDEYVTTDQYDSIDSETDKDRRLVRDLILSPEDAERYRSFLQHDTSLSGSPDNEEFAAECAKRRATAADSFAFTTGGFEAQVTLERANLVFFSVPFDPGFTAFVDGEPAEIVTADYGLMAVAVPEGTHSVTFHFLPRGFIPACGISAISITLFLVLAKRRFSFTFLH